MAFPGTRIHLGVRAFEVVDEHAAEDGRVRYELRDWPSDQVARQQVTYDRTLLGPVLAERRRLADRARVRWWSWLLYPLVGLLPEDRQIQECDRFGLEPRMATFVSGAFEATLAITLPRWGGAISLGAVAWPWGGTAAGRTIFALLFGDVAGTPLTVLLRPLEGWRQRGKLPDLTVLPLTRTAFWGRLARPDKVVQDEDGSWVVSALLPHLDWGEGHKVRMGDDFWNASQPPAAYQGGRLTHRYRLVRLTEAGDAAPATAPDPLSYQRSVRRRVSREWDRLLSSLIFRWLVSILPVAAQKRALEGRDPGPLRTASRITCGLTALLGLWFVTGAGPMNWLSGLVLFGDAAQRLPRVLSGAPAPSLFGPLFSDYLPPERDEYARHRDAERAVLAGIESV